MTEHQIHTNENGFKNYEFLKPFSYIRFGIGSALIIFFLYQLAGGGIIALLKARGLQGSLPWAQGVGQIVFMLLPAVWLAGKTPLPVKLMLRLERMPTVRELLYGLLGVFAIQLFTQGFVTLQELILPQGIADFYNDLEKQFEELYRSLLGSSDLPELMRALLIGAAIPAVAEEVLFRGLMQRSLEQELSFKKAIILTGLIFAFVHFNLPVLVPLMLIGMYLGALAYHTESLMLPVAAHFLNNAFSIIGLHGGESIESLDISPWLGIVLLTGGAAGTLYCLKKVIANKEKPAV